jgi:hypothetical protein
LGSKKKKLKQKSGDTTVLVGFESTDCINVQENRIAHEISTTSACCPKNSVTAPAGNSQEPDVTQPQLAGAAGGRENGAKKKRKKKKKGRGASSSAILSDGREDDTTGSGMLFEKSVVSLEKNNRSYTMIGSGLSMGASSKGSNRRSMISSGGEDDLDSSSRTKVPREKIRQFWLELGEADRRKLVVLEKDALLKKMREQQKHNCQCTMCGRRKYVIILGRT